MPTATRTFRVFVSSTFEDLKAERDALQRYVFPRLRKLCEENNARFQAIDLRWGVRDEAALDQQTMEICLREIERCQQTGIKPNFIVLLGERYGWHPLPARIEAEEFEQVRDRVADANKQLIGDWYERDDNAVPPEFLLKPRTGEFADKDRWGEVEQKLHRIIGEAARAAGLAPDLLIKYDASATHQEILKGLGQNEEDRKHVFAFFREPAEGATVDPELKALQEDLRRKLPEGNIQPFRIGEIEKLRDDVEESLKKVILDETSRFTSRDGLDLEIEAHDRFAADRCRIFVGRGQALTAISDYLIGPERRPLVLHGESGSGKSAVMAVASQHYHGPGRVIRRFIGASPESAGGHALLTSLCKQIEPGETPVDYYKLENAFKKHLAAALAEGPLVIFIDALDQLAASDPAWTANWLPAELPPFVKVVVSTTDDRERLPPGLPVRLERMTTAEGGQALNELLWEARRTLQRWQRESVQEHFERCGLPLYLKLAAEESRLWKSFSLPDACKLGEGIAGVIDTLFDRLASNANHGSALVDRSLGYLAAARYGLTEDEMLDVLAEDNTVWNDFDQRRHHDVSERRLPVVVWSRLSLDLEPYLTERAATGGTLIAFYHHQLAERVAAKFLTGDEAQARHADLTRHFLARSAWLDEGHKTPNARRAAELVFQQRAARQWAQFEATLFDCPFLIAKVAAGMVMDLDDDYRALLRDAPEIELRDRDALRLIQGALRLSLHVVAKDPGQFASQMRGRLLAHQDRQGIAAFMKDLDTCTLRPRLLPLWPALEVAGFSILRILEGHTGRVSAVALSADGKRAASVSDDFTLRVWDLEGNPPPLILLGHTGSFNAVALSGDGKRVASGCGDHTVQVWDLEEIRPPRVLEGHTLPVDAVALSADGKRAVSGSSDHTLRVWDLKGNQPPRVLKGHTRSVHGVALSADGKHAVSGSEDGTTRVWDLEGNQPPRILDGSTEGCTDLVYAVAMSADGKCAVSGSSDGTLRVWKLEGIQPPRVLEGHSGCVKGVAVSADGKRVVFSTGDNKTVRVWDLEDIRLPRVLRGHTDSIDSVALSADGKRAVSGSSDETLRVWDLGAGHPPCILDDHPGSVHSMALSTDGKWAISGFWNGAVRVWELEGNQPPRILEGHLDPVFAVALSADGMRAVSGSSDHTLRVWDLEGNQPPRVLRGHTDSIYAVALLADGTLAVSGSGDGTLRVWDLQGNQPPRVLRSHTDSVYSVALSLDGKRVVSGSKDCAVRVWDLEGDQPPRILLGRTGLFNAVALSGDGKRAVAGSSDETLRVWDLEVDQPPRILDDNTGWVHTMALSADGKRAVSGSGDHTLRVWDLESGKCMTVFTCDDGVCSCAWVGKRILAGDRGGKVHLFAWEE